MEALEADRRRVSVYRSCLFPVCSLLCDIYENIISKMTLERRHADAVTEPQDAVIIQIKHPDGNQRRRTLLIAQRFHSGMFCTVCVHVLYMVPVYARLFKKVSFGIIKMLFGSGCICGVLLSCFHCSQ